MFLSTKQLYNFLSNDQPKFENTTLYSYFVSLRHLFTNTAIYKINQKILNSTAQTFSFSKVGNCPKLNYQFQSCDRVQYGFTVLLRTSYSCRLNPNQRAVLTKFHINDIPITNSSTYLTSSSVTPYTEMPVQRQSYTFFGVSIH